MQKLLVISLGLLLAAASFPGAFANGGGGGPSGSGSSGDSILDPALHCKKGEVVKKVKHLGVYMK